MESIHSVICPKAQVMQFMFFPKFQFLRMRRRSEGPKELLRDQTRVSLCEKNDSDRTHEETGQNTWKRNRKRLARGKGNPTESQGKGM